MKLYHFKMFQGLAVNAAKCHRLLLHYIFFIRVDGSRCLDAHRKSMGCNTAENALIVVLNMMPESDMTETLQKVGQMWGKDITSKTSATMDVVMHHSM